MPTALPTQHFAQTLINWQKKHGRSHLPWQQNPSPYRVWLSEVMLQQTQVNTVIPYFERFTQRFHNIHQLAQAPLDEVLHLWTGLGYYARGRNLHKCAQIISQQYQGTFPRTVRELSALPGIGRSTAGAIAAMSMHLCAPILDGNVKRVLTRCFAISGSVYHKAIENQLWQLAEQLLPQTDYATYTQGIMDLGATVCTRTKPACPICPLQTRCLAYMQGNPQAYPTPKEKKHKPSKQTYMLVFEAQGQILLEKRPDTGIWGGLWSLPEVPTSQDLHRLKLKQMSALPKFKHTFSHYHLHISPLHISLKNKHIPKSLLLAEKEYDWYYPHAHNPIGLPQPVAKLLQTYFHS